MVWHCSQAKAQVLKSSLHVSVFMSLALTHAPLQFLCLSLYLFGFFYFPFLSHFLTFDYTIPTWSTFPQAFNYLTHEIKRRFTPWKESYEQPR